METQWHIVAGPTGAGKTTAAREIAARVGGVVFSIDEWMQNLYWMDCPHKNDMPWALARVARCEAQIAATAASLAERGVPAVLDLGFTQQAQREAWRRRARAFGVPLELHVLDVPVEERWRRVCERNVGASRTYTFRVTREMFDMMESLWELPDEAERQLQNPRQMQE